VAVVGIVCRARISDEPSGDQAPATLLETVKLFLIVTLPGFRYAKADGGGGFIHLTVHASGDYRGDEPRVV
jgi:hypothetical protein